MGTVASRDLRNHTSEVLRQVAEGTSVTITVNGLPVAQISALRATRTQFMTKAQLVDVIANHLADPGLRIDLDTLAGATTDDLDPL